MTGAFAWLDMHGTFAVGTVLTIAAALATARVLHRQWRADAAVRSPAWRVTLLALAQPLCAVLLYLALVPLGEGAGAGVLVVATAGTTEAQWAAAAGDIRVALPEAPALARAERMPDLETALRRHPATLHVRVVGGGLPPRDREAAQGLAIAFDPPALPRGLVELDAPANVAAGAVLRVAGRVHGVPGGEIELLDPASRRVDRAGLDGDGRFVLTGTSRVPGAATFFLRIRDRNKGVIETAEVPVLVDAPAPPRVLLLAGAPGAELKFLRRWMEDAGLPVHARIDLGAGLHGGDGSATLDAARLSRFDLVVLDERAWTSLGDPQRGALVAEVRNGLGMLLRLTSAPTQTERRRLRALGFEVDSGRDVVGVRLDDSASADTLLARFGPGTDDAPVRGNDDVPTLPTLTRRSLRIAASDGVALHADADGRPLTIWRAEGRGRIAVSSLVDTHRLVLAGRADRHAEIWSDAAATLSRPLSSAGIAPVGRARVGERIALCGLSSGARVIAANGRVMSLRIDPATSPHACAAFFPHQSGWHRLEAAAGVHGFHVDASHALPGVQARERRDATVLLDAGMPATSAPVAASGPRRPTARWPWWLGWLLASAALWGLERSRVGRVG